MRRLIACALLAVLFAIVGPQIVGPRNHSAGTPFVYEPPEGFIASTDKSLDADVKVWLLEEKKNFDGTSDRLGGVTRVTVNHSNKEMSVEEADLAKLAAEMSKVFEECTWVHRRHELRTRADGARVGLIEGDCDRDVDLGAFNMPSQKIRSRKMQLMFPDDTGTSIVTASYPTDKAARWEPLFEATISKARGVATRAPSPPPWTYGAWAGAGGVLGWLGTALLLARRGGEEPKTAPAKTAAPKAQSKHHARKDNDEDADEDAEDDEDDDEDDESDDESDTKDDDKEKGKREKVGT